MRISPEKPKSTIAHLELEPVILAVEQPFVTPDGQFTGTISSSRTIREFDGKTAQFQEISVLCKGEGTIADGIYYPRFEAEAVTQEDGNTVFGRNLGCGITEIFAPKKGVDSFECPADIMYFDANGRRLDPESVSYLRIPFDNPEGPFAGEQLDNLV
ncbi:hypothetical protein A3F37_01420 [Candidatus Saccharibacteria bacterium RIFCSPHIGHO2_12_FULL_41_12]|nr:MAG: hypothetical protein A3F37_01420 [Candidatus Saccharibacteria bacterium RIFCSPHIGHO2_12_FULL_41_12]